MALIPKSFFIFHFHFFEFLERNLIVQRTLVLGFLYNFTQQASDTNVIPVADALNSTFFVNAMKAVDLLNVSVHLGSLIIANTKSIAYNLCRYHSLLCLHTLTQEEE